MIANEAQARKRPATEEAYLAIFDEAAGILAMEYSRPVKIREVARRVATSPRQLQRIFADVGGCGFRSHLMRVRMSHAAHLLAGTNLPVKEVARRVGYGDPGQFSKAFRREHGVSPSQSRAMGHALEEKWTHLPESESFAQEARGYRDSRWRHARLQRRADQQDRRRDQRADHVQHVKERAGR
jgi:AraC family transcriptional regulator, regulatory protein of adaptative response / methylphosphotriester-DNA alkyltransferase methyltransferase